VMGSLAGDDTVFVASRQASGGHRTAAKLRVLFGLG
jgi:arginine repressor